MTLRSGLSRWLAAVLFFVTFTALMMRAADGPGWGESPVSAVAAIELKRESYLGYTFPMLAGKAFSEIPLDTRIFALNAGAAALGALSAVFIAGAVMASTGSAAAGVAAGLLLLFIPGICDVFRHFSHTSWMLCGVSALAFCAVRHATRPSARTLAATAAIAMICGQHSGILTFVALLTLGYAAIIFFASRKQADMAGAAFGGIFITALFVLPVAICFLFEPLVLDFSTKLPPWLGAATEPTDNMALRFFAGFTPLLLWGNFVEIAKLATGPIAALFIVWLSALVFRARESRGAPLLALIFPAPFLTALVAAPPGSFDAGMFAAGISLIIGGISGIVAIVSIGSIPSKYSVLPKAIPAAILAVVVAAVTAPRLVTSDVSGEYAADLLKSIRRDGIYIGSFKPDPLYSIEYYRRIEGLRNDILTIYPEAFTRGFYRKTLTTQSSGLIYVPSDEEFDALIAQITNIMPGDITKEELPTIRQRISSGINDVMYVRLFINNSPRSTLYISRIDPVISNQLYPVFQFTPGKFFFELNFFGGRNFTTRSLKEWGYTVSHDPHARRHAAFFYENMGQHYFKYNNLLEALDMFEFCSMVDPALPSCHFFAGLIFKKSGDFESAERELETAISLTLGNRLRGLGATTDYSLLAVAYRELGQHQKSAAAEQRVIPDGSLPLPQGLSRPQR